MQFEGAGEQRRRGRLWAAAAVAGVVAGAGWLVLGPAPGDTGGSEALAPMSPPSAAPSPAQLDQGAPSPDPVITAQRWLHAYREVSYTDPIPTSWADRVLPLLVEPARSQVAQQVATGAAGAGWQRFTTDRCSTRATDVGAVVPPEAPRSPTTVYVQVTGIVRTVCAAAGAGPQPDEPFSATLELHRDPIRSTWDVARRLY